MNYKLRHVATCLLAGTSSKRKSLANAKLQYVVVCHNRLASIGKRHFSTQDILEPLPSFVGDASGWEASTCHGLNIFCCNGRRKSLPKDIESFLLQAR